MSAALGQTNGKRMEGDVFKDFDYGSKTRRRKKFSFFPLCLTLFLTPLSLGSVPSLFPLFQQWSARSFLFSHPLPAALPSSRQEARENGKWGTTAFSIFLEILFFFFLLIFTAHFLPIALYCYYCDDSFALFTFKFSPFYFGWCTPDYSRALSKVVDLANHSLYGKQQVGYFPPFGHQVGCCRICALIGLWATNWSDFRNSAQFCCWDSLPFKRERRKLRLGQVRKRRRKDEDRLFSAIVRAVIAVLLASKVDGISSILASFPIPTSFLCCWMTSVSGGNMFRWTVIDPLYRSGGVLASHIYYSSCHLGSGCHLFRCHLKKLFYTLRSVTHRRPSFFIFSRPTDIYCHLRTYRISSRDHKF